MATIQGDNFKAVRVDNHNLYARALGAACQWVWHHPKLSSMLDTRDPVGLAMLSVFMRVPAVRAYLYTKRITRHEEVAQELLGKAQAWIHDGGQTSAVVALYRDYRDSGRLADLSPVESAVLRAVFGLAIVRGSKVLAATRPLAKVVSGEGTPVDYNRVGRVLPRLETLGLIEFDRGRRGFPRHSSTESSCADLTNLIRPTSSEMPDVDTRLELELRPSTILTFLEYVNGRSEQVLYPHMGWNARPAVVALRGEDDSPDLDRADEADLAASREHGRGEHVHERFRRAAVDESGVEAKRQDKTGAR